MTNENSLWGFAEYHINKKGTYINSKFRLSNLFDIDLCDEFDKISSLKMILRIGKQNNKGLFEYLINVTNKNTLCEFIKDYRTKFDFAENSWLAKYELALHNNQINFEKLQSMSNDVLVEIEKQESLNFYKKRNDSYIVDDFEQIISSSAFRRLQDKAQVYSLEKRDFVRSRLTHSNEVAANCEIIANLIDFKKLFNINEHNNYFNDDCRLIVRCSGLLHDIGNPPFGHYGEDIIRTFFKQKNIDNELEENYVNDFLKFDGNAQSLRIATKLQYFGRKRSLNLTAAVLGSIIKYPFSSNYNIGKDKFGYFQSESQLIEGLTRIGVYREYYRNPFALIMEAADDISYLTADLEDAIHKKIVQKEDLMLYRDKKDFIEDNKVKEFFESFDAIYGNDYNKEFELIMRPIIDKLRRNLLKECANKFISDYDKIINQGIKINKIMKPEEKTNIYSLVDELKDYKKLIDLIKRIMTKVYEDKEVIESEISGYKVLNVILNEYYDAINEAEIDLENKKFKWNNIKKGYYEKIMHYVSQDFINNFFWEIGEKKEDKEVKYYKMHLLVDFVSGMTDSYAVDVFNLLSGLK